LKPKKKKFLNPEVAPLASGCKYTIFVRKSSLEMPTFIDKLKARWKEGKFVCVGLDTDFSKIPQFLKNKWKDAKADGHGGGDLSVEAAVYEFNKAVIDSTHDLVCAYKINSAFYEGEAQTWEAMHNTFLYLQRTYPEIPTILDAKRADIGNTNQGYVKMAFENLKADAITVHPYLGKEALGPFLAHADRGIIVLVRTSNPGSNELQGLEMEGRPLYQLVAENIANNWNSLGNCAVVVGATYPEELKAVRKIVGDMPILIPGIGTQGGDLEASVKNGLNSQKQGIIIASSRSIIYSDNPRNAAIELDKQIKEILKNV
jgi:orotidine-5'-phosphate decarboxylase